MLGFINFKKKRLIACSVVGASVAFIIGCSAPSAVDVLNATVPEESYVLEADVKYGSGGRQTMDLYISGDDASADNPLVVFVYGGAWRSGKKEDYKFVAQALTQAGYSVLIPDYRLFPQVQYPDFVDDVVAAISKALAGDTFGIDQGRRFMLIGHSSGAHTAALLASDSKHLGSLYSQLVALIGVSGPYELPLDDNEVASVFSTVVEQPNKVNPVALATSEHPRTLLLHGLDDERVLPQHSRLYARALEEIDVPVSLKLLEDVGHKSIVATLSTSLDFSSPVLETTLEFMRSVK